jgi:hypothetical protein
MHYFQNIKGETKNISEGIQKPPTGHKILWRRTKKIRGALRNILSDKPFLQCCPIAIYRDQPLNKSQESVDNTSIDQQISDDVSRLHTESVSCTNHTLTCTNHTLARTHAPCLHAQTVCFNCVQMSYVLQLTVQHRREAQC